MSEPKSEMVGDVRDAQSTVASNETEPRLEAESGRAHDAAGAASDPAEIADAGAEGGAGDVELPSVKAVKPEDAASRVALWRRSVIDWWGNYWHAPVASERLAFVRIATGVALLTDQLIQYLPYLGYLFGPGGMGAEGLNDRWMVANWRWTVLFFSTDDMFVISTCFGLWVLSALALTVGFHTRWAAFAAWLLTYCFYARNSNVKNGGDDIAQLLLFLLMFVPSNRALAWDCRKRGSAQTIEPWGVRLLQIQLCMMYTATGLAKLKGGLHGTWLAGTSLHYVINDFSLARWSYAQFPVPIWVSAPSGYLALAWECLFLPLVVLRKTRRFALWFGVAFHVAIFLSLEVGWFSVYSLCLYPAWFSDGWVARTWPRWLTSIRQFRIFRWRIGSARA